MHPSTVLKNIKYKLSKNSLSISFILLSLDPTITNESIKDVFERNKVVKEPLLYSAYCLYDIFEGRLQYIKENNNFFIFLPDPQKPIPFKLKVISVRTLESYVHLILESSFSRELPSYFSQLIVQKMMEDEPWNN